MPLRKSPSFQARPHCSADPRMLSWARRSPATIQRAFDHHWHQGILHVETGGTQQELKFEQTQQQEWTLSSWRTGQRGWSHPMAFRYRFLSPIRNRDSSVSASQFIDGPFSAAVRTMKSDNGGRSRNRQPALGLIKASSSSSSSMQWPSHDGQVLLLRITRARSTAGIKRH